MAASAVSIAALAAGLAFAPAYAAGGDFLAALAARDPAALARSADAAALQADVAGDLGEALRGHLTGRGVDAQTAAMAEGVLSGLTAAMARTMAEPAGLADLAVEALADAQADGALAAAIARGRIEGPGRFTLALDGQTRVVFTRRGLGWRAVAIDFAEGALAAPAAAAAP